MFSTHQTPKKLSHAEAMDLLEKLRVYPALNKSGDDNIVNKLKKGFHAYKQKCMFVTSKFHFSNNHSAILTWHYRNFLRLDSEWKNDSKRGRFCRYCSTTCGNYKCSSNLKAYWEAAQLLALVMPSSGAAERVFSILSNNLKKNQTRALTELIFLSLFLTYNDR